MSGPGRPARMHAAVLHGREDVRVEQVEVPRAGPGEVLLRVEAALTCGTDVKVYRRGYHARMLVPPTLFGHEAAGVIESVGSGVNGFSPGMRVVAANSAPCDRCAFCRSGRHSLCDDLQFWNGAYAEYALLPARVVARNLLPLDGHVSFQAGALVEPLACAVRGIEACRIAAGMSVAIIGAGPMGLMLCALALRRGARVIAIGRRERRLEAARRLGAHAVLEVAPGDDLAAMLRDESSDHRGPDVVIEAVGSVETCEAALRTVRKGGVVNLFAGCPQDVAIAFDAQRLHYEELTLTSTFHHTPESVREAYRLIASGEVDPKAYVTSEAPLPRLPEVLRALAHGSEGLKTAILPRA
jgi:L-iditol 2-dehydrogenase